MKKTAYFDVFEGPGWPHPKELERYFLAPLGQEWLLEGDEDSAALMIEGGDGSEDLDPDRGCVTIHLDLWGHRNYGVTINYRKWAGEHAEDYLSIGAPSRLREWVPDRHRQLVPVGLFIPFTRAWDAVKEFMETDGALPRSIEWIEGKDLPPNTFPAP